MSDNEIDQMSRDTGRVFRQVIDAARDYIQRRREFGRHAGVPRLSRAERRELAERIRRQVGERRVTEAWFTKRVEDYRREAFAVRQRMSRTPGADMSVEHARLEGMRYGIESNLLGTGLSREQRGQIVQAMDRFDTGELDRPFYGPQLFRQPVGKAAKEARAAAARSEQWVTGRRTEIEQALSEHSGRLAWEFARRSGDRTAQEIRQGIAVQDLRHVHAVTREYGEGRDVRSGRRIATARARAAGLTPEQIRWELDNAEANSRIQVTVTAAPPGEKVLAWQTYHPTEAAAAQWVHDGVTEVDWRPGTTLTVKAREGGNSTPFYAVEGNQVQVGRDLELWHSETRDGFTHAQQTDPAREQQARDAAAHNDLAIQHSQITAERDQLRGHVDALTTRLHLSIGHSNQLDEQNSQLIRQLTALTAERDSLKEQLIDVYSSPELVDAQTGVPTKGTLLYSVTAERDRLRTERDRLRGERDEAVQKLAERTPAHERYGSPERQAEQARNEAVGRTGGSALADHQPGRALADAVARNGAERDGIER